MRMARSLVAARPGRCCARGRATRVIARVTTAVHPTFDEESMTGPLARMISLITFVYPCAAFAGSDPADTPPDLHLIPWPKTIQRNEGFLPLTAGTRIVVTDERLKPLADVLSGEIARLTGLMLPVTGGPDRAGDIVLKINQG